MSFYIDERQQTSLTFPAILHKADDKIDIPCYFVLKSFVIYQSTNRA